MTCLKVFDNVYIDTDSQEIKEWAASVGIGVISRPEYLTRDTANGNMLLRYEFNVLEELGIKPEFIWQVFCTTPFLSDKTLTTMKSELEGSSCDSIGTVESMQGFFWGENGPINWRVDAMPRTQDTSPIFKEIHGAYGIRSSSFARTGTRYGYAHMMYPVPQEECQDIDWPKDAEEARKRAEEEKHPLKEVYNTELSKGRTMWDGTAQE
jgi:N-acylneuraminate cytidylyltransferase